MTELLVAPRSAKQWQVVERPTGDGPVPPKQIKVLTTTTSKELALAFAEGRKSATGQNIIMP